MQDKHLVHRINNIKIDFESVIDSLIDEVDRLEDKVYDLQIQIGELEHKVENLTNQINDR